MGEQRSQPSYQQILSYCRAISTRAWRWTWSHPWIAGGATLVPPLVTLPTLVLYALFTSGEDVEQEIGPTFLAVGVGVLLWCCLYMIGVICSAASLHEMNGQELDRVKQELAALRDAERLSIKIDQWALGDGKQVHILLWVRIVNAGKPTMADEYSLVLEQNGRNIAGKRMHYSNGLRIGTRAPIIVTYAEETSEREWMHTFTPEDAIYTKTTQAIPTGEMRRGQIVFKFDTGVCLRNGDQLILSCIDAFGHQVSTKQELVVQEPSNSPKYFPS